MACRSALVRLSSQRAAFSTSVAARKDFVQELYLRELKGFKPAPLAKDAHVGQVKEFHTPSAPKTPEVPSSSELASQLEAYDSEVPSTVTAPKDEAHAGPTESSTAWLEEWSNRPSGWEMKAQEAHH